MGHRKFGALNDAVTPSLDSRGTPSGTDTGRLVLPGTPPGHS